VAVDALEAYLAELSANRLAGAVPETSGYGPLATLLNEVGRHLKPKVRCVINPANRGAGIPDGGFFTANQFQKGAAVPLPGQLPVRGALEVKPVEADVRLVAEGEQVRRYLSKYRQVLVTSYREFVLVGYDAEGTARLLESYSIAATELGFWTQATMPRKAASEHGERLGEFLKRCLLRQSQIASPQDLAWFLASYAREARARAEERDLPALATTRSALEEALGMEFSGEKGEHFFRSTLVQTLFYGLFAAWVFWAEHHEHDDAAARFDWRSAARYLHIPILQKLFYDFANPAQLGALHLDEVLDWAGEALNRVDRASFFSSFEQSHAVQYFYEPFLEAFDPQLRKELGVWYTPPEVVTYMVERVDQVLRSELDIADGLADPRVVVLDPCCGTGAYLVEVLDRIARSLRERGDDALLAHDLKEAARSRVYGFEILPAPFVISHLQIGMLLHRLGVPLSDVHGERAGVYLTNALTGWDPPTEPKQHLLFTEMEEERDKAEAVKQHAPILVILGNPPYNGFAGAAVAEERDLVSAYRTVKTVGPPQGQGLNDLYVRFFRMAERRITEGSEGRGVVCFISNYSWLEGLSFTGMREHYLEVFDKIWIDCLNGDRFRTGKLTPDGLPDPSVFSTQHNREGIQVGTAIALLARFDGRAARAEIGFRQSWGSSKLVGLSERLQHPDRTPFQRLCPSEAMGLSLSSTSTTSRYFTWPSLPDIYPRWFSGVQTKRDDLVVDVDLDRLQERMTQYFDSGVSNEDMARSCPRSMQDTARFNAKEVRGYLQQRGMKPNNFLRYCYRPFDLRWVYWEPETKLLGEKSPDYPPHVFRDNLWIEARQKQPKERFDRGYLTRVLSDNFGNGFSSFFPALLAAAPKGTLFSVAEQSDPRPNLTPSAAGYVAQFSATAFDLMWSIAARLHSPSFRSENAGALRQDWPRIPLPATCDVLLASVELGRKVATLLGVEDQIDEVTTGSVRRELRPLGVLASVCGDQLDPSAGDLAVTAGWGHAGQNGVTMPGRGMVVERAYADAELAAFREGLADLALTHDQLMACLGGACYDVYLNERAYWRCVPARVWTYTIGGYQVMKKWLSYRERPLLGRDLRPEEARYVTEMVRRIAATLLLEPALDENYARVKADTYLWPGSAAR
jgi:hypothetical protein